MAFVLGPATRRSPHGPRPSPPPPQHDNGCSGRIRSLTKGDTEEQQLGSGWERAAPALLESPRELRLHGRVVRLALQVRELAGVGPGVVELDRGTLA